MKRNWRKIWRIAKEQWLDQIGITGILQYRRGKGRSSDSGYNPYGVCRSECSKIQVVVTPITDNLDYIDEVVLDNELEVYRRAGFPIIMSSPNKQKEFVQPLWVIEVFQNEQLARQITYYLQPIKPDRESVDVVGNEVPNPSRNE